MNTSSPSHNPSPSCTTSAAGAESSKPPEDVKRTLYSLDGSDTWFAISSRALRRRCGEIRKDKRETREKDEKTLTCESKVVGMRREVQGKVDTARIDCEKVAKSSQSERNGKVKQSKQLARSGRCLAADLFERTHRGREGKREPHRKAKPTDNLPQCI